MKNKESEYENEDIDTLILSTVFGGFTGYYLAKKAIKHKNDEPSGLNKWFIDKFMSNDE